MNFVLSLMDIISVYGTFTRCCIERKKLISKKEKFDNEEEVQQNYDMTHEWIAAI